MRSTQLAIPFALLALIVASPRPALACQSPCPEPLRLWGDWLDGIPGNLVYFEVDSSVFDDTYAPFALRTAEGEPIAASIRTLEGDQVFAPDEPIAPGTNVVLEYDYGCPEQPHERRTFAFTTTEPVVAPPASTVPTLGRHGFVESEDACDMAFVELELSSLDGAALAALTDLEITVDGEPAFYLRASSMSRVQLQSFCDGYHGVDYWYSSCGALDFILPGKHLMEVRPRLVGLPDPEPQQVEFEIQCQPGCYMAPDAEAEPAPTAPDANGADGAADAPDAPGGPPGDVLSSSGSGMSSEGDVNGRIQIGGCSLARGAGSADAGWLPMLLLPWLVRRRRAQP